MTNTPITFDEWFDSEKFDFEAGTERYHNELRGAKGFISYM